MEKEKFASEARMTTAMQAEFDVFWKHYPLRHGKIAARKAYEKARAQATAQQILDGVTLYVTHKPKWQAWAHPASWLNAGRWLDEYDTPTTGALTFDLEQSDLHQQMYRHNATYRANYDAKQQAS